MVFDPQQRDIWDGLVQLTKGKPDLAERLMGSIPEQFAALAIAHGLDSALCAALGKAEQNAPDDLRRGAEDARFVRLSSLKLLPLISDALDRAEIEWVVLKGLAVAAFYEKPELRSFSDLDLLVRGVDFAATIDALQKAGIAEINRNWDPYLRYGIAECPMAAPGVVVDLHWHLVATERSRNRTSIDISAMLGRRRRVEIGRHSIWALDPEDQLMHICIHAGLSGADRLGWLLDVHQSVSADSIDWDVFVGRVKGSGMAARVGQVLDRARHVLEAAVPADVPPQLCQRHLLSVRRHLDMRTVEGRSSSQRLRTLPVRGSGDSVGDVTGVIKSAIADRIFQAPNWDFSSDESDLYYDASHGDSGARARYLRYAAGSNSHSSPS